MTKLTHFILILTFILTGSNANYSITSGADTVESLVNISISQGQYFALACESKKPVKCVWSRNSKPVAINGRYKYLDPNNGINTKNCTIEIAKTNDTMDSGNWTCTYKAKKTKSVLKLKEFRLEVLLDKNPLKSILKLGSDVKYSTTFGADTVESLVNISISQGQYVALSCESNMPVNCVWSRNSIPVIISGRYKYLDRNNGTNTKNCTIEIAKTKHFMDSGNWTCTYKANQTKKVSKLKEFRLEVLLDKNPAKFQNKSRIKDSAIQVVQSPDSAYIAAGQSFILSCKFNSSVNCLWKRNSLLLSISERYEYIDQKHGENTTNCSIKIKMAAEIDSAIWTCAFRDMDSGTFIQSNPAYLIVSQNDKVLNTSCKKDSAIQVVQSPDSGYIAAGQSVILSCKFNSSVNCLWMRNSLLLNISGRYEYIDQKHGEQTTNCSIKIKMAAEIDSAIWTCALIDKDSGTLIQSNPAYLIMSHNDKEILWISPTLIGVGLLLTLLNTISLGYLVINHHRSRSLSKPCRQPIGEKSPIEPIYDEIPPDHLKIIKMPHLIKYIDDQQETAVNVVYESISPAF